jgi:hypothetical protein
MLCFPTCQRLSSIVSRRLTFITFNVRPLLQTRQFSRKQGSSRESKASHNSKEEIKKIGKIESNNNDQKTNTKQPPTLNSNIKSDAQLEVDTYIRNNLANCTKGDLCDFILNSAKNVSFLTNHLPVIAIRIKELSSLDWNFSEISSLINSLQLSNETGGIEITSVIETVVSEIYRNEDIMTLQGKHIAMLLYGLQNIDSSEDEIKSLLSVVFSMIRDCKDILSADDISISLYGLKGMSSDCSEVLNILSALSLRIRSCNEEFTAQNLSDAFYGLQGLSSDKPEMRALLTELSLKVHSCEEDLNAQGIGKIMYGLKGMRSNNSEVRDVLLALTNKILSCKEEFKAEDVGNSLYGLQGLSRNCSEVNDILSALSPKVLSCKENLTAKNVSYALCGLHVIKCNRNNNSIYLPTIEFLHIQAKTFNINGKNSIESNESSNSSMIETSELVDLCQTLTFILPELAEILPISEYFSWKRINMNFSDELARRKDSGDKFYKTLKFRSNTDRGSLKRIYDIIEKNFDGTDTVMHSNIYICDMFVSDIVMEINLENEGDIPDTDAIVNVEIDGVHHRNEKRRLFCVRRDKYLKSRDVIIVRIDLSTLEEMNDIELAKWVVNTIVMQL